MVFPAIEERLKARRHHLEPIDLRWGVETRSVAEDQAKELLILKVCLTEIKRSRPFIIGLLGDRYGWVPPEGRIRTAAQEIGFDTDPAGKSVTALEVEFGVLADPQQRRRCHFYCRQPLPYQEMPPAMAALYSDRQASWPGADQSGARLDALKARLFKELPDRARLYEAGWDRESQRVTGLEAWGRQVLEDLWQDLEIETREFAARPPEAWQDQERWVLEQFVEALTRDFVGREALLHHLASWAAGGEGAAPPELSEKWGAVIVGDAGAGKSALFAQLYRRLQQQPVLLLAHAAGVSPASQQVDSLLRRWVQELAAFLEVEDPAPALTSREDLQESFRGLLVQAAARTRVVCLLDALNQFERTQVGKYLTWLPGFWPENVRFLATTLPGTEAEALRERAGVASIKLDLLNPEETAAMVTSLCRRYHKKLHPEILEVLTSKKIPPQNGQVRLAAGSPLWLHLAVEELLLLDEDDFARQDREFTGNPEEKLHQLLLAVARELPPEVEALYAYLLRRTEAVHGEKWAREFAHLLAVTRGGLREADFQALLPARTGEPWEEVRFAALRRSFRAHLVQKGALGQWDFAHAQMREAIGRRSLPAPAARETHQAIALYLEELPRADLLRQTELMFHFIGADDKPRAARLYAGFQGLASSGPEMAAATQALAAHLLAAGEQDPNPGLEWALSLPAAPGLEPGPAAQICRNYQFDLLEALANDARLPLKLAFLVQVKRVQDGLLAQEPENPLRQRDLSVSYDRDRGRAPGPGGCSRGPRGLPGRPGHC